MNSKFVFVLLAIIVFVESSNLWRYCPPCKCFGDKQADCSKDNMNITLNNVPDFLSSEIEVLNITKHNIITLKNDVFINNNFTNLWKVFIMKCEVKIIEKYAFRNLDMMTDLSLMHNEITNLDSELFSTNTNLKYLWLDNNKIKKLPNGLCSELIYLNGFYARFNQISVVENEVFGYHSELWIIDISNNKLQYLNATIIDNLKYLKVLFLHENMWSCDCRLQPLHEIMLDRDLYNLTKTLCAFPNHLKGKELKLMEYEDFKCWQNISLIPEESIEVYEYNNVTLSCFVDALPMLQINWIYNNTIIYEDNSKYILHISNNDTAYFYNITILNIISNDTGKYICKVVSESESIQDIYLNVLKVQEPSVKIIENITGIIQSERKNFILSCRITGTPKPNTFWALNNTNITSFSDNFIVNVDQHWMNLTIYKLNYIFKGNYSCNAYYTKFLSTHSIFISVSSPYLPEVKIITGNTFRDERNATICCVIRSYSFPKSVWKYNYKVLDNNSNKYRIDYNFTDNIYFYNLTIINITNHNIGNYSCTAKSLEGEVTDTIIINNILSKPKITISPSTRVPLNNKITLLCNVQAFPKPDIFWEFNNGSLNKIIGKYEINMYSVFNNTYCSNLTIFNVTQINTGLYICTAKNTEGISTLVTHITIFIENNINFSFILYAVVCLIAFLIFITILIVLILQYKGTSNNQMANISTVNEEKIDNIPLENCEENDKNKEDDFMYKLERDITSYNVTDAKK